MKKQDYLLFFLISISTGCSSVNVKEAKYDVLEKDGKFEIRKYAPQIIAETIIDGTLEDAGNKAFSRLFKFISGNNTSNSKISMTAPVSQTTASEKIKMTAPVSQQKLADRWVVSFMMPASYTMETIPVPKDARVKLRKLPARRMAAVKYSGFWSEKNYRENELALQAWIIRKKLNAIGEPVWARYNSPFSLWFLRRNEILIELENMNVNSNQK